MIVKEYGILTIILYCILAIISSFCLYFGHQSNGRIFKYSNKIYANKYYVIWFIVWVFFAVFRYIKPEIGGEDAYYYVEYFEKCLEPISNLYSYRAEPFFRLLTKIMRFIFVDYHLYFFVIYGTITAAIIKFLDTYYIKEMSVFPAMVASYVYIYSFNIMRSGWSIAIFLFACSFLKEEKYFKAIFLGILSVLIHTASVFYFPFIIFYIIIQKSGKHLNYKLMFIPAFGMMFIVERLSFLILDMVRNGSLDKLFNLLGLGQPFDVYANAAYGSNFWLDFIQLNISRFQIIPIILLFIFYKPFYALLAKLDSDSVKSFYFIEIAFIYELILLPAIYYFHMWRSSEYFVFIRVIFWGLAVYLIKKHVANKINNTKILMFFSFLFSILLFIYKINYAWDMSSLMPYYLEPIGLFIDTFL